MQVSPCKSRGLDELYEISVSQAVNRKEQLFLESEPADNVYRVTDGVLKAYKLLFDGRCQVTGFFFPGDFVGIEHSGTYVYSVDAVTRSTVARYRRQAFQRLLERDGELRSRLLSEVVHEINAAQDQMVLLARMAAEQRLAALLLILSKRAVARGEPDTPVYMPMTCIDIGDHLGLTMETVSRMYTRLYRRGIISRRTNGEVQIFDREALSEIVLFNPPPTASAA